MNLTWMGTPVPFSFNMYMTLYMKVIITFVE